MSIYIDGLEMPKEGNEIIIRIQPDGVVLDQYGHRYEYIFTNEQAKALLHYIIPADKE